MIFSKNSKAGDDFFEEFGRFSRLGVIFSKNLEEFQGWERFFEEFQGRERFATGRPARSLLKSIDFLVFSCSFDRLDQRPAGVGADGFLSNFGEKT